MKDTIKGLGKKVCEIYKAEQKRKDNQPRKSNSPTFEANDKENLRRGYQIIQDLPN